jgi:hypothetical protein
MWSEESNSVMNGVGGMYVLMASCSLVMLCSEFLLPLELGCAIYILIAPGGVLHGRYRISPDLLW